MSEKVRTSERAQNQDQKHEHERDRERTETERERECPDCGTMAISDEAHGELVCEDCGLVLDDQRIDHGPEWRATTSQEHTEQSRTGTALTETLHDKGLSTAIGWQNTDARGNRLSEQKRQRLNRMRTQHEHARIQQAGEHTLKVGLGEIDRMASALGVTESVREVASTTYRRAHGDNLLLGRSIEGMASGGLYAACRQAGFPRSLDEIAAVARVERVEIGRAYRYLADELGIDLAPSTPQEFIPRFASELDVSTKVETTAVEIVEVAQSETVLAGVSPTSAAAAALYAAGIVCEKDFTQDEIGEVAGVTHVTIRHHYRDLLAAFEEGTD
jgi:transcription initiation factor TFIIB